MVTTFTALETVANTSALAVGFAAGRPAKMHRQRKPPTKVAPANSAAPTTERNAALTTGKQSHGPRHVRKQKQRKPTEATVGLNAVAAAAAEDKGVAGQDRESQMPKKRSAEKLERRRAQKAAKRAKLHAHRLDHSGGYSAVVTPTVASSHPFEAEASDHAETPFDAYRDIEPFLFQLALRLKKTKAVRTPICLELLSVSCPPNFCVPPEFVGPFNLKSGLSFLKAYPCLLVLWFQKCPRLSCASYSTDAADLRSVLLRG
eukprot:SAG11_NODE_243_length_11749_cov_33.422918_2_plen_260_part_00